MAGLDVSEEDRILACNLIESYRKAQRRRSAQQSRKNITTRLSKEEGRQLSIHLQITYHPKNESVVAVSCLHYCRRSIYPGIHQARTCHNQAGIDRLSHSRERVRAYTQKIKANPELREKIRKQKQAYYQKKKEESV